ncbi:MAG: hypothetical protein Q8O76_12135 [Chloroflexota bacterium]|nr:hypothetical protein [Chloroflexota bacterium]
MIDMRDKYSPDVPDEMIFEIYRWQEMSPFAQFLDLTKWPTRYPDLLDRVPKNVVIGATIETNRPTTMRLKYAMPAWLAVIAAVATAITGHAHKANLLGYYSICSFVPASTLICLAVAGAIYWFGLKRG